MLQLSKIRSDSKRIFGNSDRKVLNLQFSFIYLFRLHRCPRGPETAFQSVLH